MISDQIAGENMIGTIIKVASATAALGFAAGIVAHRKAEKAADVVKEKVKKTRTEVIQVEIPKGVDLDKCKIQIFVPSEGED